MRERNKVTEYAKEQLEGPYGSLFSRNADDLIVTGEEFIKSLGNAEQVMQKYIKAAREEDRIRQAAREWESMKVSLDNIKSNEKHYNGKRFCRLSQNIAI